MNTPPLLAIVVPVYKVRFLSACLESLASQTVQQFSVHIFDDGSPEDVFQVVQPFLHHPNWIFHRFDENLGRKDLAGHWSRCVRETTAPWVWLFSDDDLMQDDCVESFFKAHKAHPQTDVFAFSQCIIDEQGQLKETNFPWPDHLSAFGFGNLRFNRKLYSSGVGFVFSRKSFDRENGFVSFPLAWNSDDASWISFAGEKGIRKIEGGLVSWRVSDISISGLGGALAKPKIEAALNYMIWFRKRFPNETDFPAFIAEQVIWLRLQMVHMDYIPGFWEAVSMVQRLDIPFPGTWLRALGDLYALSDVYHQKVVLHQNPRGFRALVLSFFPKF